MAARFSSTRRVNNRNHIIRTTFFAAGHVSFYFHLVTLVLHYFMFLEDDPIEGLKHVGDILNPF